MEKLFGPAASDCPIWFCSTKTEHRTKVVVGTSEEVIHYLQKHPELMKELSIRSIDTLGLGFTSDGTNGDGTQFEEHFKLTPGEKCVVYQKTDWEKKACIKPYNEFHLEAELKWPPIGEEVGEMEEEDAVMSATPSSRWGKKNNFGSPGIRAADGSVLDSSDPFGMSKSKSGLRVDKMSPRSPRSSDPIAEAKTVEDDLDMNVCIGVEAINVDADLAQDISFGKMVPAETTVGIMHDPSAEYFYEEPTQPSYDVATQDNLEDSCGSVSWMSDSRRPCMLLHQHIKPKPIIESAHVDNDIVLHEDCGLIFPVMINTEGVR
jgi:hypothetical protein